MSEYERYCRSLGQQNRPKPLSRMSATLSPSQARDQSRVGLRQAGGTVRRHGVEVKASTGAHDIGTFDRRMP